MIMFASDNQSTIYIAFRGTEGLAQLLTEMVYGYDQTDLNDDDNEGEVNKYFHNAADTVWNLVAQFVNK